MPISLCPAELLILHGADATAFAHAQFSNDVKSLAPGAWQWSAWLDAQGRVRFFFALIRAEPSRLIAWLPLGGAQAMREALARFVMRAAVRIDMCADWHVHALDADERATGLSNLQQITPHGGGFAFALPGADERIVLLAPHAGCPDSPDALNRWRQADIAAGLPLLAPALAGEFVPQALDLERLGAIRFDKGCYPGQEIAARLHFRGGNKRHLQRLRIDGVAPLTGALILDDSGATVGKILYSAAMSDDESAALGVLPLAQDESKNLLVTTNGMGVRREP